MDFFLLEINWVSIKIIIDTYNQVSIKTRLKYENNDLDYSVCLVNSNETD